MDRIGKQDLTDEIMTKTGLTRKDADAALNAFLDIITEAMTNGSRVTIPNFGTFEVIEMKERIGRNIHTGETMTIKAKKKVKFSAGKGLAEAVK